jgi:phosphatidylinositol 4-kinase
LKTPRIRAIRTSFILQRRRSNIPIAIDVLTHLTSSVHGLVPCHHFYSLPMDRLSMAPSFRPPQSLAATHVLERINRLLLDIHQEADTDPDADATSIAFCHTFISRYIAFGRPLSGYLKACCVMDMQWIVLAKPSRVLLWCTRVRCAKPRRQTKCG